MLPHLPRFTQEYMKCFAESVEQCCLVISTRELGLPISPSLGHLMKVEVRQQLQHLEKVGHTAILSLKLALFGTIPRVKVHGKGMTAKFHIRWWTKEQKESFLTWDLENQSTDKAEHSNCHYLLRTIRFLQTWFCFFSSQSIKVGSHFFNFVDVENVGTFAEITQKVRQLALDQIVSALHHIAMRIIFSFLGFEPLLFDF